MTFGKAVAADGDGGGVKAAMPAVAAGGVCGIAIDAGVVPSAAAMEFAEGGVAPTIVLVDGGAVAGAFVAVTDCGTDCDEGSTGAVDFATNDEFSGVSCLQNAQRGPDWQPTSMQIATTTNPTWFARELITWLPCWPIEPTIFADRAAPIKQPTSCSSVFDWRIAECNLAPIAGKVCCIQIFGKTGRRSSSIRPRRGNCKAFLHQPTQR